MYPPRKFSEISKFPVSIFSKHCSLLSTVNVDSWVNFEPRRKRFTTSESFDDGKLSNELLMDIIHWEILSFFGQKENISLVQHFFDSSKDFLRLFDVQNEKIDIVESFKFYPCLLVISSMHISIVLLCIGISTSIGTSMPVGGRDG